MIDSVFLAQLRGEKDVNTRRVQAESCEGAVSCVALDVTEQLVKPSRQHVSVGKDVVLLNIVGNSATGNVSLGGVLVPNEKWVTIEPKLVSLMKRPNVNPTAFCTDDAPKNERHYKRLWGLPLRLDLGHLNRRSLQTFDHRNGRNFTTKSRELGLVTQHNCDIYLKSLCMDILAGKLNKGAKIELTPGKMYVVKGTPNEFDKKVVQEFLLSGQMERTLAPYILHKRRPLLEARIRLEALWRSLWVLKSNVDASNPEVGKSDRALFHFPYRRDVLHFPSYPSNDSCFTPKKNEAGRNLLCPGFIEGSTYHAFRNMYRKLPAVCEFVSCIPQLAPSKNGLLKCDDRMQSATVEGLNARQQAKIPGGYGLEKLSLLLLRHDVVDNIDRKRARDKNYPFHGHYQPQLAEQINELARQAGDSAPFPKFDACLPLPQNNGELFYGDFLQRIRLGSSSSSSSSSAGAACLSSSVLDASMMTRFSIASVEILNKMRYYNLKRNKVHEGHFPCQGNSAGKDCHGAPVTSLSRGRRSSKCTAKCPRGKVQRLQQAYKDAAQSRSVQSAFAAYGSGSRSQTPQKRVATASVLPSASASPSKRMRPSMKLVPAPASASDVDALLMDISHGDDEVVDLSQGAFRRPTCTCMKCAF